MFPRSFILLALPIFSLLLTACSKKEQNTTLLAKHTDTRSMPATPLSAEQEQQRRQLAQSFAVAGMHLGMGYGQAKTAVLEYLANIDEQDKPFRLKEADYVDKEAAFYDQRYATLKTNFYAYYGKHSTLYPSGVNRTYDRVRIRADFVPTMVWSNEQPLYLYKLTQAICPQTDEELNHIIAATLEQYGPPDNIVETGPNSRLSDAASLGRAGHYIWRLNSTGETAFTGNSGYIKNGMQFYDDLVLTLKHKDIKNWYSPMCNNYKSRLELSITDELYHARSIDLHNAYINAGQPDN